MAALQSLGEDCPISFTLLSDREVRQRLGEHIDLVSRKLVDRAAFEDFFRVKPHAHQLVAETAGRPFSAIDVCVAGKRAGDPDDCDEHNQRVYQFDGPWRHQEDIGSTRENVEQVEGEERAHGEHLVPQTGFAERSTPPGGETGISVFDEQEHPVSDCNADDEIEWGGDDLWYRDRRVENIETGCEQLR